MTEYLSDLRLNGEREVEIGSGNDLRLTEGFETVEQSVGIHCGDALRRLVGEPITETTFADAEDRVARFLDRDPQVSGVQSVSIDTIDRENNTVSMTVHVDYDESFEISPTV